jgi:hypothetical protein
MTYAVEIWHKMSSIRSAVKSMNNRLAEREGYQCYQEEAVHLMMLDALFLSLLRFEFKHGIFRRLKDKSRIMEKRCFVNAKRW